MALATLSCFAGTGTFFNIAESGIVEQVNITLCLNGKGPLTCQQFTVNHGVLDVSTITPGHTYPIVGAKVNTPGYRISEDSECSPISNGYCIFSASETKSANIIIIPSSSVPQGTVSLSVNGSPLSLNVTRSAGRLTVTNGSTTLTAVDIVSNFSGTDLEGNVEETINTCQSVDPGRSCSIRYRAGTTAVNETQFLIQGLNTTPVSASIAIDAANVARIRLVNRKLSLETSSASGTMIIRNASSTLTALNVASNFIGTALNGKVTETGNTCSAVAPGDLCTLTFTPGASAVAQTAFPVQGTNTTTKTGYLSITSPPTAALEVQNSPLLLNTNGASGALTITNLSSSVTATNITSNFTGTALSGNVTETGNTCSSLAPGTSCTLTYTPGSTAVAQTDFTIQGTNTDSIIAAIQIDSLSIGSDFGGGIVACLTSTGGLSNLIATRSNLMPETTWAPTPLYSIGATSTVDGANNTATIVAAIGPSPAYAAGRCDTYEVDTEGNTPCQSGNTCYNDWYLPATDELGCLYQNRALVGGFGSATFWSSTEVNKNSARAISFQNGSTPAANKASYTYNVRCVRTFTP